MLTSTSILLALLLAVQCSTSTGMTDPCLETRLEGKRFPQSVFLAKKVASEVQCRHLCLHARLCSAYSFRLPTRMCELTADIPSSSSALTDDAHAVFGVLGDTGQCPEFASDPCNTRPCSVSHLCARVKRQDYICLHLGSPCGQPLAQQSEATLKTSEGIVAYYVCPPDHVTAGGNDRSVCLSSGLWSLPGLACLASQTTETSVSHTTQASASQTTQTSESLTTQTSVSQTTQASVSQTTHTSESLTTQTSVNQTTQTSLSPTTEMSANQTTQTPLSQTTKMSVGCSSPPDTMGHATLTATPASTVLGALVTYQCDQNYYVGGNQLLTGATSICLSTGSWSVVLCVYLCPAPVTPANANLLTLTPARMVGSTVTYYCGLGYSAQPAAVSTCVEGGGWSNVTCVPVSCGIPQSPLLLYGVVSYTGTTYGATAIVQCRSGSLATIVCQVTGLWSPSCLLIDA